MTFSYLIYKLFASNYILHNIKLYKVILFTTFHTTIKMAKSKIAISVDNSLLKLVDSKVDGSVIRSRSHAIEYFMKKGLQGQSVNVAVLLIKGEHQENALEDVKGIPLIRQQINFFANHGINQLYVVTQHTKHITGLFRDLQRN